MQKSYCSVEAQDKMDPYCLTYLMWLVFVIEFINDIERSMYGAMVFLDLEETRTDLLYIHLPALTETTLDYEQ
jgi:hypothetical protein